jgi:putative DNA primase/helicase
VREPGCEVQAMLVLTGGQGVGKTRGLKALAGAAWFSSTAVDIGSKDAVLQLRGKWLLELAEMDSLKKAENTRVKAWVSSAVDNIRPPFGRHTVDIPRETVFAATTNQPRFLTDATGSRRYMVVCVGGQVDIGWITQNRDQLWAEAQALYDAGTPWWWTYEEAAELQRFNEEYQERDPWDELIRAGLARTGWVTCTATQVLVNLLAREPAQVSRWDQERVSTALAFMGCTRTGDTFAVPESLRVQNISGKRLERVTLFNQGTKP